MRIQAIVAPAILGIAIAAWPGAALAAQILGIALAVAPALTLGVRAGKGKLRRPVAPARADDDGAGRR